jgi:LuxR family maltose regulon positive regulatory protein
MIKARQATLSWSQEEQQYLWYDQHDTQAIMIHEEPEAWLTLLATSTSFAFHGRKGQITLRKEARPRGGDGYWYAYRRQGKRIAKKYAGRTTDLTTARLEQMASILQRSPDQLPPVPSNGDIRAESNNLTTAPGEQQQPGLSSPQQLLLLSTLQLPPLHPSLVSRERLLTLLDRALEHRLTLVSAPTGFGKTTLVRQWVAERSTQSHTPPLAWVSLDQGDNDPMRFWRYVLTSCQILGDDVTRDALTLLQRTPQPPFEEASLLETALTLFLNALAQHDQEGILLLDDYQAITSPRIHQTLTFFLTYIPAGMHVILLTRNDPPFSLTQLRVRSELFEVRTAELRFSLEETAALLQQTRPTPLAPEIVQRVHISLEGWAAGLRLLQVALRDSTTPREIEPLFRAFAGGQSLLQDYVIAEVLETQPETLRHFVLQTSVLTRLTGSLCVAITGECESAQMLETVARANLFLEPLQNASLSSPQAAQWYRYHGLFAEAMRAEARRRLGEERLRELSARASRWYEAHHLCEEAIEAALYAQDYSRAAILIEQLLQEPSQVNAYHTLCNWLQQLPEALFVQYPTLCLGYARALLFMADAWLLPPSTLTPLEKIFQIAEERYRSEQDLPRLGEVFAFRALAAWRQEKALQAASYARQALAWLPEEQLSWRGLSLSLVGKAELLYHGRIDLAREFLEKAYPLCKATDDRHFRLSWATTNMLALAFFEQGDLHRAFVYYQEALQEARERYVDSDDMAHSLLGLARIAYAQNDLDTAWQHAHETLTLGQALTEEIHEVRATLLLARIQHARGETAAARQLLNTLQAERPLTLPEHIWPLSREIQTLQARLALADGDLIAVQRWVTGVDHSIGSLFPGTTEQEQLMLARWLLAQGKSEEARHLLQNLLQEIQLLGRKHSTFEIQALLTLVYARSGQQEQIQNLLLTLLTQTCTEGYLRLFLDEGEAMAVLLRPLVLRIREQPLLDHLQRILRAFPSLPEASPAALLPEPLSSQEQRVLRLLVSGRSTSEMANALVVSINTVRTHLQNIYRKLDVHNRAEALEAAHHLHLLS